MNSNASNEQSDVVPEHEPSPAIGSVGVLLAFVLLLAVALVGVFCWDTWTAYKSGRQTAGDPEPPVTPPGLAPPERSSVAEHASGPAGDAPSDLPPAKEPSKGATGETIDPQSDPNPPPDASPEDSAATEPAPIQPNEEGTRILTALAPLETTGVQIDRGDTNSPIRISTTRYERAICVQPSADEHTGQVTFSFEGKWARLTGVAGISGTEERNGAAGQNQPQAVFRIYGDANLVWESEPLSGQGASERFQVDVGQLDIVALVVESRGTSDDAQPVWADLRLTSPETLDVHHEEGTGQP